MIKLPPIYTEAYHLAREMLRQTAHVPKMDRGNWNNAAIAGVFTANLNNDPSNTNIGFRCVFRPARLGYFLCRGGYPQLGLTLWLRVTTKTKALRPSTRAGLRGHSPERSEWAHGRPCISSVLRL